MRRFLVLAVLLPVLLGGCACDDGLNWTVAQPKEKNEKPERKPGDKNRKMPVMGGYRVFPVAVEELSGLCMNQDSTAFWAVGDEGALCKISFEGIVTHVRNLDMDTEGITIDPATGNLYVAVEGDQMVCRIAAPDYQTTPVEELFYIKEAVEEGFDNNGLEGIAFYQDSLFFVGSQEDAVLWTCTTGGAIVSRISLMGESPLVEEIAGLYYDAPKKWLWVTDSDACKLFIFSTETFDLLASYDVPFIDNAESICVDRARGCVWVGSDEDSPKLYKFSFTF